MVSKYDDDDDNEDDADADNDDNGAGDGDGDGDGKFFHAYPDFQLLLFEVLSLCYYFQNSDSLTFTASSHNCLFVHLCPSFADRLLCILSNCFLVIKRFIRFNCRALLLSILIS